MKSGRANQLKTMNSNWLYKRYNKSKKHEVINQNQTPVHMVRSDPSTLSINNGSFCASFLDKSSQ